MARRIALVAIAAAALLAALAPAALAKDRNHDRIPDRWERAHHLSLKVNQARRDQDHDQLDNLREFRHHSDPRHADSDHDGLDDGDEVEVGDDPADHDSDDDGVKDGEENAGTVKSFDGSTLVISLAGGDTLSGSVDSTTELECEGAATASERGSDDDNSGPGSGSDSDDDHGDDSDDDDDAACGTAALKPGTVVHEAELRTVGGKAVWHEVELRP